MNNPSVIIENLSRSFSRVEALKNINLSVDKGELFGFIGPDGAGKTTLFRILVTLLLPGMGKATVEGFDVVKDYKKIRRIVGYMPGRFSLYQDLSVEENLKFFAGSFKTTIKENYHLIEGIYRHIEPFRNRLAGRLSGGMKQKLALSCALVHKPDILFLDEPTTGVDAVSRKEFWEMLKRLQDWGITIVVSTPYMDEASLCDRVALIQQGSIMKIDSPENISRSFKHQLLSIRADDMFNLVGDLESMPGCRSAFRFGAEIHFTPEGMETDASAIKHYLEQKSYTGISIREITPGIEDCFMDLMKREEYAG